jgi:nucleoside-triphosphatase THEP1
MATDFYSIGAIVFNEIFGQTPASKDLRYDSKFNYENNKLFKKISPVIYIPLTEFFHKTLQATPSERYKNDDEIIQALDSLVCASSPVNIYLSNHAFSSSDKFIGREDEFDKIEKRLHTDRICFIHGMGGIGKTEIAKQFANRNRDYYHTVHAIKYSGDLKKDILDMDFVNLNNKYFTDEKGEIDIEKLYKFKKDKIQELDERTLIIIDNFNIENDEYLKDIITHNNGHHTLFTTKNEVFQKEQYYIEIKELPMESSLELFYSFYKDHSEESTIKNIIEHIGRNTLAVKLIASAMQKVAISPCEMLAKLHSGMENVIAVRIKHNRDILEQNIEDETLFNHLCIVFELKN